MLLEKNADVNKITKDGWTALMGAARKGHLKIVELLLEEGADVKMRNDEGKRALDYAEESGNLEMIELLGRFIPRD